MSKTKLLGVLLALVALSVANYIIYTTYALPSVFSLTPSGLASTSDEGGSSNPRIETGLTPYELQNGQEP